MVVERTQDELTQGIVACLAFAAANQTLAEAIAREAAERAVVVGSGRSGVPGCCRSRNERRSPVEPRSATPTPTTTTSSASYPWSGTTTSYTERSRPMPTRRAGAEARRDERYLPGCRRWWDIWTQRERNSDPAGQRRKGDDREDDLGQWRLGVVEMCREGRVEALRVTRVRSPHRSGEGSPSSGGSESKE
jgi:hypothetical protein